MKSLIRKFFKKTRNVPFSALGSNDLGLDAKGHQKITMDTILFSSKFISDISKLDWILPADINGTGNVISDQSRLILNSGTNTGDYGKLYSRRHPPIRPNKGQLYNAFIMLPDYKTIGFSRIWGAYFKDIMPSRQSGVLFELTDDILYGKLLTTHDGILKETTITIDYSKYDLNALNEYEIQYQWNNIYSFYINKELVGNIEVLGKNDPDTKLSVINGNLPARFECINNGGTGSVDLICASVSISTESTDKPKLNPVFIETAIDTAIQKDTYTPLVIGYIPFTFKDQHNTRDSIITRIGLGSEGKTIVKAIITRDRSIFGKTVLGDLDGETDFKWYGTDSLVMHNGDSIKYSREATLVDLSDPTKYSIVCCGYIPKVGDKYVAEYDPCDPNSPVISHGDYIILAAQSPVSGTTGFGGIALGEEL